MDFPEPVGAESTTLDPDLIPFRIKSRHLYMGKFSIYEDTTIYTSCYNENTHRIVNHWVMISLAKSHMRKSIDNVAKIPCFK